MCVVNKQFELLEFIFDSVYVDLQYDEISLTFTAGSVCLCGVCSPVVVLGLSVRFSYVIPYVVGVVVAVTVMHVLFVLHVCMLREYEGAGKVGMGFGGICGCRECVYGWYTWFKWLSSACDWLEMSVVRGVDRVCDICMCFTRGGLGGVGGEWLRRLCLGFTIPGRTWGKWDMCLCFGCGGIGGVGGGGGVGGRIGPGSGWVGWCYFCVCCESGFFVMMVGPGICILC